MGLTAARGVPKALRGLPCDAGPMSMTLADDERKCHAMFCNMGFVRVASEDLTAIEYPIESYAVRYASRGRAGAGSCLVSNLKLKYKFKNESRNGRRASDTWHHGVRGRDSRHPVASGLASRSRTRLSVTRDD